jgi:hypothetical protein
MSPSYAVHELTTQLKLQGDHNSSCEHVIFRREMEAKYLQQQSQQGQWQYAAERLEKRRASTH